MFLAGKISHNSRPCGHATLTSTFTLFLQPYKYVPIGHDISFSSSPSPSHSPTLSKSLSNCAVLGMMVEGHCWVHADRSRCMRMLLARIAGLMWWLRSRTSRFIPLTLPCFRRLRQRTRTGEARTVGRMAADLVERFKLIATPHRTDQCRRTSSLCHDID